MFSVNNADEEIMKTSQELMTDAKMAARKIPIRLREKTTRQKFCNRIQNLQVWGTLQVLVCLLIVK